MKPATKAKRAGSDLAKRNNLDPLVGKVGHLDFAAEYGLQFLSTLLDKCMVMWSCRSILLLVRATASCSCVLFFSSRHLHKGSQGEPVTNIAKPSSIAPLTGSL